MYQQLARRGEESPRTHAICASLQSQSGLACSPILSLFAQAKGIRRAVREMLDYYLRKKKDLVAVGSRRYLGQEIVAASSQSLMSVTLQTASCQRDDNDWTPEQREIGQSVLGTDRTVKAGSSVRGRGIGSAEATGGCLWENTYAV